MNGLYRWSRVQGTLLGASGFFSVFGMGLTTQHRATGYYDKATARQRLTLAQQSFFSFVQRTEAAALFGLRCNTYILEAFEVLTTCDASCGLLRDLPFLVHHQAVAVPVAAVLGVALVVGVPLKRWIDRYERRWYARVDAANRANAAAAGPARRAKKGEGGVDGVAAANGGDDGGEAASLGVDEVRMTVD